jgi:hypothetical protein
MNKIKAFPILRGASVIELDIVYDSNKNFKTHGFSNGKG